MYMGILRTVIRGQSSFLYGVEFMDDVLKVTLVENKSGGAERPDLQRLESLAVRLFELDNKIEECKVELSETQAELEEFKRKSAIEKRLCELTGMPFVDKSGELEKKVNKLKEQLDSLNTERAGIYRDILKGLADVVVPIQGDTPKEASEDEVFFAFRENRQFPAIIRFIRRELKFGTPPVYVALRPEGIRVVGVNDKAKALEELVNAIEELRRKARKEADSRSPPEAKVEESSSLEGEDFIEEMPTAPKNVLQGLKKFGKR